MRKPILLFLLSLLCLFSSQAQTHTCGFDYVNSLQPSNERDMEHSDLLLEQWKNTAPTIVLPSTQGPVQGIINPGSGVVNAKYIIPVKVHVVHDASDGYGQGSNISLAQIENQIEALNKAFRGTTSDSRSQNTDIYFCLYDTTRTASSYSSHKLNEQDKLMDAINPILPLVKTEDKYFLNIYVVKELLDSGGTINPNIGGYSSYPGTAGRHGIVMLSKLFGDSSSCTGCPIVNGNQGKLLAHEVGHYFHLYHTFREGCAGTSSNDCSIRGDKCCDTPPVFSDNTFCVSRNSCANSNPDMIENYMDYTPDNCKTIFTYNQVERMHFTLERARKELSSVKNINNLTLHCSVRSAIFSLDKELLCVPDSIHFTGLEYDTATYIWKLYKNNLLVTSHSSSTHKWTFFMNDTAVYDVELQIVLDGDTARHRKNGILELRDCGDPIASTQGNWYFGIGGGLNFRENGVIPNNKASSPPGTIKTQEGCISISDEQGNLLFYGGGNRTKIPFYLFDKGHDTIKLNVAGIYKPIAKLLGNGTDAQSSIAFPTPQDSTKYYIFTSNSATDSLGSVYYSILDLNLGLTGRIDTSFYNIPLPYDPTLPYVISNNPAYPLLDTLVPVTEEMSAIPMCNGKDHWLIKRNRVKQNDSFALMFYAVTSTGVQYSHYRNIKVHSDDEIQGIMKISPNGRYLSIGNSVYKFDRCEGSLELLLDLGIYMDDYGTDVTFYATAFSPSSKLFYFVSPRDNKMYQLDLTLSSPLDDIKTVTSERDVAITMQLGPDNKIYITKKTKFNAHGALSVIHNPNSLITSTNPFACNYEYLGQGLTINGNGGACEYGLPNMVDALPEEEQEKEIWTVRRGCDSFEFLTNVCCAGSFNWKFGDGNTSEDKNPFHVYSGTGSFSVQLIAGQDTIYDTVVVEPIAVQILGDTGACDSTQLFIYQTSSQQEGYSYAWETDTGVLYVPSPGNEAHVRWPASGRLSVIVTDRRTGCKGKDTINITISGQAIFNNFLTGLENYCDSTDTISMLITGSIPSGGSSNYTYKWYKSIDEENWEEIAGATSKDYLHTGTKKYHYYRMVSSGCESNSNIVFKTYRGFTNLISNGKIPCVVDSFFLVSGNNSSTVSNFNFNWQYSNNKIVWNNYSNQVLIQLEGKLYTDSLWIRRKVSDSYCPWNYSDTVLIKKPTFSIKTQPKDVTVCDGDCVPISVEMNNEAGINLTYDYNGYTICGNSSTSNNYSAYAEIQTYGIDSFRVKVDGLCGQSVYSDYAQIQYVLPNAPLYFTKQPVDFYGYNNNPTFTATSNTLYSSMSWEKSYDRGLNWIVLPNENDTILNFHETVECDSLLMLRAVLFDACKTVYSDTVKLHPHAWDLWMKDLPQDTGAEVFEAAKNNFTHSPDIWVRYTDDNQKHSNPWGPNSGGYQWPKTDTTNWVYTTIRNKGTEWSDSSELYLYWTIASTGEVWPLDWVKGTGDTNRFYNADSMHWFPKGGEININPIIIAPLAPGDSINISYYWNDSVPNPAWYYIGVGGQNKYFEDLGICFLARIETCNKKPYSMTYPEVGYLGENIPNNNNIASHNTILSLLNPPNSLNAGIFTWIPVKNIWDINEFLDIGLDVNNTDYFNNGEIVVMLDDDLETKWILAGQMGTGYTMLSSNTLLVSNPANFSLTGLSFAAGEEVNIGYLFREIPGGASTTGNTELVWFEAWQQTQGQPHRDGTVSIFVDAPTTIAAGGGDGDGGEGGGGPATGDRILQEKKQDGDPETKFKRDNGANLIIKKKIEKEETIILKSKFTAYPNPFKNSLTVEYSLLQDTEIEICLTDVLGRCIIDVVPLKKQTTGSYKKVIHTENITAGMYYIELKSEGKVFAKKLIRIN